MAFLGKGSKVVLQYMATEKRGGNSGKEETGRFRAEDGGCRNGVRNPEKLIELEGEGHFTRACLDIEVSTGRGNIGNEVRSNLNSETIQVEVEQDRLALVIAKEWSKGGRWKNERKNSLK
ncbi:hypothetical protein TNCV_1630871 [Trichonephila clavipes]|nr:hypothetical protein TNCV_1630871 [Trichonephila clavipes]